MGAINAITITIINIIIDAPIIPETIPSFISDFLQRYKKYAPIKKRKIICLKLDTLFDEIVFVRSN